MNRNQSNLAILLACSGIELLILVGCDGSRSASTLSLSANAQSAIETLNHTIDRAANAKTFSSTDVGWGAGVLPWDRFTLPVISPNGHSVAVQLGLPPSISVLIAATNEPITTTKIELHLLDPVYGKQNPPIVIDQEGLILSQFANDNVVFVESPNGNQGRWIGKINWLTGDIEWLVNDDEINAFPTSNHRGDLAWSKRHQDDNRFHLVVRTDSSQRSIDDGESDWVFPLFLGNDRLRVFRINNGALSLVELDIGTTDPLLTAMSLPLLGSGGTRAVALQIATTNQMTAWQSSYAFYHPQFKRMTIWEPSSLPSLRYLARKSIAAVPVGDGSWIVATNKRVLRQFVDEDEGIHVRNQLAIPIATTSEQWTHFLLEPKGNRLNVRAIHLDR